MKNPRQKEKKRGDMRRRRKVTFDEHKTQGEEMRGDMRRRRGTFDEDKTRPKQEMHRYEKKRDF